MKKLTCKDLGGPCDADFLASSFEEIGMKSHAHVVEQIEAGDQAHADAALKMRNAAPEEQKKMMEEFQKCWDEAPEEN